MAKESEGRWITVNGRHVLIGEGESLGDAIKGSKKPNKPKPTGGGKEGRQKQPYKEHSGQYNLNSGMVSYGEGWDERGHVKGTDMRGTRYYDKGKMNGFEIGKSVEYENDVWGISHGNYKVEGLSKDKDGYVEVQLKINEKKTHNVAASRFKQYIPDNKDPKKPNGGKGKKKR